MKRILIAEDNDSNYMLMTYILKNHYEFFRAHNGQEALEMIRKEPYDMVLMDLKMPIMNGLLMPLTVIVSRQWRLVVRHFFRNLSVPCSVWGR